MTDYLTPPPVDLCVCCEAAPVFDIPSQMCAKCKCMTPRFALGRCLATMGALGALEDNHTFPIVYLKLHEQGVWGDLSQADKMLNEAALEPGQQARIMSAYKLADGQRIYVITEWDRSVTTILLPTEY